MSLRSLFLLLLSGRFTQFYCNMIKHIIKNRLAVTIPMALSPISSSLLHSQHNRDQTAVCLDWFGLMLNVPVNSYGHVGQSVHLPHFFPGQA